MVGKSLSGSGAGSGFAVNAGNLGAVDRDALFTEGEGWSFSLGQAADVAGQVVVHLADHFAIDEHVVVGAARKGIFDLCVQGELKGLGWGMRLHDASFWVTGCPDLNVQHGAVAVKALNVGVQGALLAGHEKSPAYAGRPVWKGQFSISAGALPSL